MLRPAAPGLTGRRGPMANDSGVPTPGTADQAEDDGGIEVYGPPLFGPGAKVRANTDIRNDGTMPGVAVAPNAPSPSLQR